MEFNRAEDVARALRDLNLDYYTDDLYVIQRVWNELTTYKQTIEPVQSEYNIDYVDGSSVYLGTVNDTIATIDHEIKETERAGLALKHIKATL